MKVLLLTKSDYPVCDTAIEFTRFYFDDVTVFQGVPRAMEKDELMWWEGDLLLSFLSPWVVPASLLRRACYALNWHPAPPEYPGIGGYNFALYNGDESYGCTCHHMAPKVDSGRLFDVERFPIFPQDTVWTLMRRTHERLLGMFLRYIEVVAVKGLEKVDNNALHNLGLRWARQPYIRKDLEDLCEITLDMDEGEIERRIKATTFPGKPGARLRVNGRQFALAKEKP